METLIFLISNAFLAYIIWRFAYKLFLHYDSIRPAVYMTIRYYLINSFCTIVLNNPTINLLSSLIGLLLIALPCKDRLIKKIFFIILVTSIGFVWDVLMYAFINRPDSLNAVRIIANLSLFVVEIIFETIFSHLENSAIYREDGTIRETGTIPNGEPRTRYSWTGITLYNSETAVLKPAGANGLYAYAGTRIEFSYTLNRLASHFYALTGNNVGYLSSGTSTGSAGIISTITEKFDSYYGIIVNYSSDPFTIIKANIVF